MGNVTESTEKSVMTLLALFYNCTKLIRSYVARWQKSKQRLKRRVETKPCLLTVQHCMTIRQLSAILARDLQKCLTHSSS